MVTAPAAADASLPLAGPPVAWRCAIVPLDRSESSGQPASEASAARYEPSGSTRVAPQVTGPGSMRRAARTCVACSGHSLRCQKRVCPCVEGRLERAEASTSSRWFSPVRSSRSRSTTSASTQS